MMRIEEKSSDHLWLSNTDSFWSKWGFVAAIVAMLLGGIFISVKIIHPTCWGGVIIFCIILFLLVRDLPHNFDYEYLFNRESDQLKAIAHPWLGRPQVELYPLSDITEVRKVEIVHRHDYPGSDYIEAESQRPIESPDYKVDLTMRSGYTLTIYQAAHLAGTIAEFLGLTLTTA